MTITKILGAAGLAFTALSPSLSQSVQSDVVASVSETDRMALIKTTVPLSDWHEDTFWSQYTEYREMTADLSLKERIAMQDLVREPAGSTGYELGTTLVGRCVAELAMKRKYYAEVGQLHNGVIALKFLQTELLLDLMESLRIYEQTYLQKYRFNPDLINQERRFEAEYNVVSKLINLSAADAPLFLPIYSRFEREREETLGDQYELYALFAGEPADFTPGLAKRQGYDLLSLIDRELKLKEKYFHELNSALGPEIAAKFLAWQDYYSIQCKLKIWAAAK